MCRNCRHGHLLLVNLRQFDGAKIKENRREEKIKRKKKIHPYLNPMNMFS